MTRKDVWKHCVALVPVSNAIEPVCETGLRKLEDQGMAVWRMYGCSDIVRARSKLATRALARGYERLLWIDADVVFERDDVQLLLEHTVEIVGGIYPVKGERRLACSTLTPADEILFGEGGGLKELKYLATGFLLTGAVVYETMQTRFQLPTCRDGSPEGIVPYFTHEILREAGDGSAVMLSEGFSFCERARRCGFKVHADTRIRLGHLGKHAYSWEDAGSARQRFKTYRYQITSGLDGGGTAG